MDEKSKILDYEYSELKEVGERADNSSNDKKVRPFNISMKKFW